MDESEVGTEFVFSKRPVQWIILCVISCVMLGMTYSSPDVPFRISLLNAQWLHNASGKSGEDETEQVSEMLASPYFATQHSGILYSELVENGGRESTRGKRQRRWLAQVNLNSADALELALLPGVGRVLAERIVSDRVSIGAFKSVDDLQRVRGIGPGKMAEIREMAVVAR
jgi:competence ComEA-like helix-hairpin-helix protein